MNSHKLTQLILTLAALMILAMSALAADPGQPIANGPTANDQKAGSVLVYNIYASSSTDPAKANTRLNLTNTDDVNSVFVHLFFIDGASCSVADSYVCLSKSQTTSILASDVDPDITGYMLAVAVNQDGSPRQFNKLIGDEYVKFSTGHIANLGAVAVAANSATPAILGDGTTAALNFDGNPSNGSYEKLPRVLALDSIASRKDGNDTLLIVNRISGNMTSSSNLLDSLFGIMFDELETGFSFTTKGGCQLRQSLSDSFPRTTPRFTNVIAAGSTGWMKFWTVADNAILGAAINQNAQVGAGAFNGGHNLHALTLTDKAQVVIPVFPAMCS